MRPEKVSGSAITNESTVRRCDGKRDRYNATTTPTALESVAATSVKATLPPSAVQNPEVPKTRANAAPPSRSASTATAMTGSAKNSARRITPAEASASWLRVRMSIGQAMALLAARRRRPTLVDVCLLRRCGLHVQRMRLRRGGQLVGNAVRQLDARNRRSHE